MLLFNSHAATLKGGVSEEYIPYGFYGSWAVISKLKNATNLNLFNYESRDIWVLSGYSNVLILENLQSGAHSEIIVREKSLDNKTLKFERQKTSNNQEGKVVYKETVKFDLSNNSFFGSDDFIVEFYNKEDKFLKKETAHYSVSGTKLSGQNSSS